jgi:Sulfocyanin (SoxE) domain
MPSLSIASPAGKQRRSTTVGRILAAMVGLVIVSLGVPASAQQQRVDPTWLSFDTAAKTVRFQLIAGLTGLNGALNFNGFRDGELTFVVPVGWQTEIDFRNHDGMLPHSAQVIAPQTPLPTQPVGPAIPRAFTLKLAEGLPSEATDIMRFAAEPAGEYLIFCGVPGHGAAGMWIRLRVSATPTTPALLLTPAPRAS